MLLSKNHGDDDRLENVWTGRLTSPLCVPRFSERGHPLLVRLFNYFDIHEYAAICIRFSDLAIRVGDWIGCGQTVPLCDNPVGEALPITQIIGGGY